jgi:hypothetical protein
MKKKESHKFSFQNMMEIFLGDNTMGSTEKESEREKYFMQIESYTQSTTTVKVMRIITVKSQEREKRAGRPHYY